MPFPWNLRADSFRRKFIGGPSNRKNDLEQQKAFGHQTLGERDTIRRWFLIEIHRRTVKPKPKSHRSQILGE